MKIHKNIVLLSITIVTLISLMALATYSYFTAATSLSNKITTNVKIPLRPTFTVSGGGEISLIVTKDVLLQENGNNGSNEWVEGKNILSAYKNLTITLTGEPGTTCTYNVYYKDTSSNSTILSTWDLVFTLHYNSNVIFNMREFKLLKQTSAGTPKITAFFGGSSSPFNIAKPVLTIPSGNTSVTDTWKFGLHFLNLIGDQSALAGKTFKGELYIDDVSCT